tara:strand:- start:43 stop:399 length:357 start_codon:yes stop_codon:yes gene_type:complete
MFGLFVETCFTALRDLIRKKDISLIGHTSIWMFPIYGFGLTYGFDFITYFIESDPVRYASYPLWIWAVEIIIGFPALLLGVRLWDYHYLPDRLHWRGIISFAHYPLWMCFGILVEAIK